FDAEICGLLRGPGERNETVGRHLLLQTRNDKTAEFAGGASDCNRVHDPLSIGVAGVEFTWQGSDTKEDWNRRQVGPVQIEDPSPCFSSLSPFHSWRGVHERSTGFLMRSRNASAPPLRVSWP